MHWTTLLFTVIFVTALFPMRMTKKVCNSIAIGSDEEENAIKSALKELLSEENKHGLGIVEKKTTASTFYARARCDDDFYECKKCITALLNIALDVCYSIGGQLASKNCAIRWEPYSFTRVDLKD